MKTLTSAQATLSADGKTLTAVFTVSETQFNAILLSRNTHGYINELHQSHRRHLVTTNAAVLCEAPGSKGAVKASILNEALIDIFTVLEPHTSFLPQLKNDNGAVKVISELPVTFQWQLSSDGKTWTDIAGAVTSKLDDAEIKPGQWSRLVIQNAKGQTVSKPLQKPVPPPAPALTPGVEHKS